MSNKTLIWFAKIVDGKIKANTQIDKKQIIETYAEGDYLIFSIKKLNKKRSNLQNNYYWGVVVPVLVIGLREVGYEDIDSNTAHELMKLKYLKKILLNKKTGEITNILGTTTELTAVEFNEYLDKINNFAIEYLNTEIPLPNEFINNL